MKYDQLKIFCALVNDSNRFGPDVGVCFETDAYG